MIELNLLPEELKKKRKRIELPEIPIIPIALSLVGIMVIIQLLLTGVLTLSKKRLAVVDKKWQGLAPAKEKLDKLKRKISGTDKKIRAIDSLMEKRMNWAELLNELSNSLTANVWLSELSLDERIEKQVAKKPSRVSMAEREKLGVSQKPAEEPLTKKVCTLTLSGSASGKGEKTTEHIASFITSIKNNGGFFKNFEDIELVSIKQGTLSGEDVMNFILVCKFKPEKAEK